MKIIIEIPDYEFNWDGATVHPVSDDLSISGYRWDIDFADVTLGGKKEGDGWEFADADEPADYLIEMYRDAHG